MRALLTTLVLAGVGGGAALLVGGCTDTLDGERFANQKPIVHFANIPPEGQTFSRNPVVYWYGSDADGLIDYYRYHVATEAEVGFDSPENYIQRVSDAAWTHVDVDPAASDPQTTHQIPLAADSANPVRSFVVQYVFLQAFDMEGLGSDIVYRRFARNDNPPNTGINDISTKIPFVNAPRPGGIVTGIALDWMANDSVDYPSDPPRFEFQWRLYGPYTNDEMIAMEAQFVQTVFQSVDGFVYRQGEYFKVCDTTFVSGNPDPVIDCDSFLVGTDEIDVRLGRTFKNYFDFEDADFVNNPVYYKVVDSSCYRDPECLKSLPDSLDETACPCLDTWVPALSQSNSREWAGRDTLYNVFRHTPTDSTVKRQFLFWIRSRDDAKVPDPTPAWKAFPVVEPKFERDVLVFDMAASAQPIAVRKADGYLPDNTTDPSRPRSYLFWRDMLLNWNPDLNFNEYDYIYQGRSYNNTNYTNGIPLVKLLQYKVVVLYNDHIVAPPITKEGYMKPVITGLDAGVNAWSICRSVAGGDGNKSHMPPGDPQLIFNQVSNKWAMAYKRYFAVNSGLYTGWFQHANRLRDPRPNAPWALPAFDVQDCIGAYSLQPAQWPDIEYDSALVHDLYEWGSLVPDTSTPDPSDRIQYYYNKKLPYLPEINWCQARYGAEIMYLYKSYYRSRGVAHPLGVYEGISGSFNFDFEGAPCGHRYSTGLYRTVHMNLTPFALKRGPNPTSGPVAQLFRAVMDYLYDPNIQQPVAKLRYHDADPTAAADLSVERDRYWKRCDQEAYEKGLDLSAHALANLHRR